MFTGFRAFVFRLNSFFSVFFFGVSCYPRSFHFDYVRYLLRDTFFCSFLFFSDDFVLVGFFLVVVSLLGCVFFSFFFSFFFVFFSNAKPDGGTGPSNNSSGQ